MILALPWSQSNNNNNNNNKNNNNNNSAIFARLLITTLDCLVLPGPLPTALFDFVIVII